MKLMEANTADTSAYRARRGNGDMSQHGNGTRFRNGELPQVPRVANILVVSLTPASVASSESYNEKPMELTSLQFDKVTCQQGLLLLAKVSRCSHTTRWQLPEDGVLEFDFVKIIRPRRLRKMRTKEFEEMLYETGVYAVGEMAAMRLNERVGIEGVNLDTKRTGQGDGGADGGAGAGAGAGIGGLSDEARQLAAEFDAGGPNAASPKRQTAEEVLAAEREAHLKSTGGILPLVHEQFNEPVATFAGPPEFISAVSITANPRPLPPWLSRHDPYTPPTHLLPCLYKLSPTTTHTLVSHVSRVRCTQAGHDAAFNAAACKRRVEEVRLAYGGGRWRDPPKRREVQRVSQDSGKGNDTRAHLDHDKFPEMFQEGVELPKHESYVSLCSRRYDDGEVVAL